MGGSQANPQQGPALVLYALNSWNFSAKALDSCLKNAATSALVGPGSRVPACTADVPPPPISCKAAGIAWPSSPSVKVSRARATEDSTLPKPFSRLYRSPSRICIAQIKGQLDHPVRIRVLDDGVPRQVPATGLIDAVRIRLLAECSPPVWIAFPTQYATAVVRRLQPRLPYFGYPTALTLLSLVTDCQDPCLKKSRA